MVTLKSIIYISPGNLPSLWAHTVQIAKMSQAFSRKIKDFELLTSGDIWSIGKGMDIEFQNFYGLQERYKLTRIPHYLRVKYPLSKTHNDGLYCKLAVIYACFKKPSLIYTRSPRVVELLLKIGKPVFYEYHGLIKEDYLQLQFLKDKNLIGMVTISSKLAENYIQLGLDPDKVLVAHSAVDLNIFLPYQEKDLARQKISLPLDAKIILYSGHLYDTKGIPTILKIARMMPEYKFVLVGGWVDDINRVKENVQKEDLRNVYIIGHVPQSELASYLYAGDIMILPTSKSWNLAEVTSPLKLFEYMAVKKPIVASALPNIMTVLRDGENSLLAEPDNALSFQEAIVNLFENPLLASTIAECAFQEVQNFTWDNRADQVLQFASKRLQEYRQH
jgi:glycosyltransferase involved in cell wall biosynthesis